MHWIGDVYLYALPSGPSGQSLIALTNPSVVPSGECCLTMAAYAERVAEIQASRGPYRRRTWSLARSICALRSSVFLVLKYVKR